MGYEFSLGLKYVLAKNTRHLLIAILAMLGILISVAAVIFILSLLTGFGDQLRSRILGYVSHAQISGYQSNIYAWEDAVERIYGETAAQQMGIIGVAPYVDGQGLVRKGREMSGAIVRGIVPEYEAKVSDINDNVVLGNVDDLRSGEFGVLLGIGLATKLGLYYGIPPNDPAELAQWQADNLPFLQGQTVDLLIPQASTTPAGVIPRMRRLKVKGIVQFGMGEYDANVLIMHAEDASLLYQMQGGMSGLRVQFKDPDVDTSVNQKIVNILGGTYRVSTWKDSNPNLFAAIELEKTAMFVVLCVVTLIASFLILATMMILVTEKRSDIAIMRTLGASPQSIAGMFLITGIAIGGMGTVFGIAIGVLMSYYINEIKSGVEWVTGQEILPADVYYITELSREIDWNAVASISAVAMGLCILFTLIPAIRASQMQPAEILRHD